MAPDKLSTTQPRHASTIDCPAPTDGHLAKRRSRKMAASNMRASGEGQFRGPDFSLASRCRLKALALKCMLGERLVCLRRYGVEQWDSNFSRVGLLILAP